MGQALYRKYRPRNFSEAIGQDAVTSTLKEALKSGRISHAYLFAGPRGVGKTSIARILAHEVNNLPYQEDSPHLDIIEIDAASNRRIDEIRELREKVHITPVSAKYKVYIIDEVHMLTKEAFNALLKTLEEPPAHCIFILATTEAHKLPETIISRTQRFNFKPINPGDTTSHLSKIAKSEKIDINAEALALLAEHGEGSMRDILGLLDLVSSGAGKITEEDVRSAIGIPPRSSVDNLVGHITAKRPQESLAVLENLKEQGASPALTAKALSGSLRNDYIDGNTSGTWLITLLHRLLDIPAASQPQESLELAVLEAAGRQEINDTPVPPPVKNDTEETTIKQKRKSPKENSEKPPARANNFDLARWNELLARVKEEAPSLYTALRLAEPEIDGSRLRLAFRFPLHQKKAKEAKHQSVLAALMSELGGSAMPIDCVVDRELAAVPERTPITHPDLQSISNIFGSAEVLES